ncbi:MAG: hypothetical protein U0790_06940 [Isosphaeraceae bacterium]
MSGLIARLDREPAENPASILEVELERVQQAPRRRTGSPRRRAGAASPTRGASMRLALLRRRVRYELAAPGGR